MPNQTAKLIKELRYRLGMTQEQFAMELGVTLNTINRWENGKSHPSPLALEIINQKIAQLDSILPIK
jgi:putative transcriptional regulator